MRARPTPAGNNVYEFTVVATDDQSLTDTLDVVVTVSDVNEGPVVSGSQSLSFVENQATDRILATYAATDPEDPSAVISRWSLSGSDAGDFTVSGGGELSFRNVPDFEAPADSGRDNVYDFSVRASDGRNYGYLEVTVTVEDVNEAPVITTTSRTSFSYRESGTATIYTFSATDPEGGTISWSPGGADGDDFAVTVDSRGRGVLAFSSPPDFENPADADRDNVYEVTVVATDDQSLTDSVEVTVTVSDVNEGPVVAGVQSLSFAENQATDRILATYSATDPEDPGTPITRWSLSGSDAGDFTVSGGGELSFRNVPDYERPADSGRDNVYDFSVRASDGRNYGYLEVTVTVEDVNEAPLVTGTTSFTYRENGTATIYTFSAADPEGGTISWSPGGADGDDFTITADSRGRGVLAFSSPPDFQNPTDADRDNVYEVTVVARDSEGNRAELQVEVTVVDQNEGPVVSGVQSLSFVENQATDRILAAYAATDPEDPGAVISRWSLSGSDAGDFTVSGGGELSFRNVPDFEAPADSGRDNVYDFSVRASDGRNYGYLEVTVTVEDVNEAPLVTGTTSFTYRENGTATIYTFRAADPERGTISWSPGGADGDDFAVTVDSRGRGVLAFSSPPDFENPADADRDNVYEVTVVARDSEGNRAELQVEVTVVDQNEGPVVAGVQSLSFAENLEATGRILAAYTATDPEDPGASISRWSLSGSDAGDFAVSGGGELSFRNVPDYEAPADSGRDNVYDFSVRASDGRNYGYLEVTVTVEDVNEAPLVTGTTSFTYRENGTATIYTFRAADPERGTISWSPGGADGDDFTITVDSRGRGVLTFSSPPDFENPTDADRDNVYEVTVVARDDAFNAGTREVTVTVSDVNEGPVVSGVQSLSFAENLEESRVLAAYAATDPEDPGAVISRWSLSGSDAGDFRISGGGELSFRNVPDYEAPADSGRDNVYDFSVRASDGRNYGYLEVTVTVEDVNEAPLVTGTTSFTYRENGTATIYTFRAADPERGTISWSPGGADGDDFTITADSRGRGVLTFSSPPDFENPADADRDNVYEVTVEVTDDQSLTDSVEVTVTVSDVNEGPVVAGVQSLSFAENQATDRILAAYTATDPEDPGASISRWSLSGSDAGDFAVSGGGELSFRNVPDYEAPADSGRDNVYDFSVRASDGRNYGYLEVTVTVEDVNEAPLVTGTTSFTYRENGTATIYTFRAADPERGTISWSPGGADGDDFTITVDSRGRGVLTFSSPPDFENPTDADRDNVYEVTVEARDDAFNAGTREVTVTVSDVNEGPVVSGVQSLSFAENLEEGRVLAAYAATDPEDPGAVISRWSLSGSDAGDFRISGGGELSFRKRAGLRGAGGLGARQRL